MILYEGVTIELPTVDGVSTEQSPQPFVLSSQFVTSINATVGVARETCMRRSRVFRLCWLTLLFAALVTTAQASPAPDDRIYVNGQPTFTIGYTIGPPLGAKTPDGRNALAELKKQGTIW